MADIHSALEIKINTVEAIGRLGAMAHDFGAGYSRLKIAMSRAINRTLTHMRKLIVKDIQSIYCAKKSDVDKTMKLTKAKSGKIASGSLRFIGPGAMPLIDFAKKRKHFISVRVLKTSRAKMLGPGGPHNILATKKGRARAWISPRSNQVVAMTELSDEPRMLWGPSFLAFFRRPGVAEQLQEQAANMFQKRLQHEAGFMLTDAGLVTFGRGK